MPAASPDSPFHPLRWARAADRPARAGRCRALAVLAGLAVAAAVLPAPRPAHAAAPTECAGVHPPASVSLGDTSLTLNGLGLRTVRAMGLRVKVYVAALYLETPSADPATILAASAPWHLVLHFVRDVDRANVTEGFTRRLVGEAADAPPTPAIHKKLDELNGWMPDMPENGTLVFTFTPGQGLKVAVGQDVKGTIPGDDFARAFLGIWLGAHPANPGLKTGLLGGRCG